MKSVRVSFRTMPGRKERIRNLAERTHRSESFYYNLMLDEYLAELEDLADAARISAEIDEERMKTYSLDEVRKEFGV